MHDYRERNPFVTDTPAAVKKAAEKIFFLEGHWAYNVETTSKLFDMCFDWKAGKQGREVTLIGGDVHVGYTTRLSCNKTNQSLTAICTSPITNHVSPFYGAEEGDFSNRYHFKQTVHKTMRNYCVLEASFDDSGMCTCLNTEMKLFPTKETK